MNNVNIILKNLGKQTTVLFFCASIFVMTLLMQALFLTWLSQFKIVYLTLSAVISFTLAVIFFYHIHRDTDFLPHINIKVIGIIMLICIIGIFFPHETFGGRDEGSYSNAAVMLSKNTNLLFSSNIRSTIIKDSGEDTQNVVAFATPGYYVWLAIQCIFFGLGWMLRSNIILIFLGLCGLFIISSLISNKSLGFIIICLYVSCMPFLWFFRETMSENLAFFLLWTAIAFLFSFYRTKRTIYLVGLMLATWIFSFTRLEGLLIQFSTFLVFSFILLLRKIFSLRKNVIIILVYLMVIFSSLLIQKPFNTNALLSVNIRKIDYLVKKSASGLQIPTNIKQVNSTSSKKIKLLDRIPFFIFYMLVKYNLVVVLLSIFLLLPAIIPDRKTNKTTKIYLISLFIILLPEYYKFIDPAVTLEQPWMYRRYLYALLPMGYICFVFLFSRRMSHKFTIIFTVLLITINIFLSRNILFLKNNWSLTEQLDKLLKNVSPVEDFVIIKEWVILNNYYPTSYLTFQKGMRTLVRYSVDTKKWLPKKNTYNGLAYKRLFLLSDKEVETYKNFNLIKVDSIVVKYTQLEPNCNLPILNSELGLNGANLYSLPFHESLVFCSKIDNKIFDVNKKIFLYEMVYTI